MADLGAVGLDAEIAAASVSLLDNSARQALTKVVEGTITDDVSAAAARTVRVYSRATGQLLGETTSSASTGFYSVRAPDAEVQRIVLDDTAGTLYNDLIDRVLPGAPIHAATGALSAQSATAAGTAARA